MVPRADRGYFCLPEADINIPFTEAMTALIKAKLTPAAATDAIGLVRVYATVGPVLSTTHSRV